MPCRLAVWQIAIIELREPGAALAKGAWRRGSRGLGLLQLLAQFGDLVEQLFTLFAQLAQFIASDGDVEGLCRSCR